MTNNEVTSSNSAAFARLFWMMVGPASLAVFTIFIMRRDVSWLSFPNIAFLVVLASMIFARWWEFRGHNPTTGWGEPATPADLRKYVLSTTVIGLCIWLGANLLRTYGIAG